MSTSTEWVLPAEAIPKKWTYIFVGDSNMKRTYDNARAMLRCVGRSGRCSALGSIGRLHGDHYSMSVGTDRTFYYGFYNYDEPAPILAAKDNATFAKDRNSFVVIDRPHHVPLWQRIENLLEVFGARFGYDRCTVIFNPGHNIYIDNTDPNPEKVRRILKIKVGYNHKTVMANTMRPLMQV